MARWLNCLFVIIALASGVAAGTPLKSGEKECAMSKQMKCCKRNALGHTNIKEKFMAKVCGTLFCEHSGTTASTPRLPQFSTLVGAMLYLYTLPQTRTSKQNNPVEFDFSDISLSHQKTSLFIRHHAFRI